MSERPFQILGLQQVALGALEAAPLATLWLQLLGLRSAGHFRSESENVDETIARCGPAGHEVEIDLMTPIDPEGKPRVHQPALNHIGLWVDDLPAAVDWLGGQGVRFTPGGIRSGASGHAVCFIHPRGNEDAPVGGVGVLIELVQAPMERGGQASALTKLAAQLGAAAAATRTE